jgi:protein-tyrosine-phosphatase
MKTFSLIFFLLLNFMLQAQVLLPSVQRYCEAVSKDFSAIDPNRREDLDSFVVWLRQRRAEEKPWHLTFICTHNSRRSQFAQVWAKVAAVYYGLEVETYSGGTEVTACNHRTIRALERAGLVLAAVQHRPGLADNNPLYRLQYAPKAEPLSLFSKLYSDSSNPQSDFTAILVCSSADEACPLVPGAALRFYHGYDDPKRSDGSAEEATSYDATCRLIALEWLYVFSQLQNT